MSHGSVCHGHLCFGRFALIITLHRRIETNGKVSGFTVGPALVWIAIFSVAFALAFALADFRAVNKAAIGGIITDT